MFGAFPCRSENPKSDVTLAGICSPGVVPPVAGRANITVTVTVVVAVFQLQIAFDRQLSDRRLPSRS